MAAIEKFVILECDDWDFTDELSAVEAVGSVGCAEGWLATVACKLVEIMNCRISDLNWLRSKCWVGEVTSRLQLLQRDFGQSLTPRLIGWATTAQTFAVATRAEGGAKRTNVDGLVSKNELLTTKEAFTLIQHDPFQVDSNTGLPFSKWQASFFFKLLHDFSSYN